jgi:hypothetical protein
MHRSTSAMAAAPQQLYRAGGAAHALRLPMGGAGRAAGAVATRALGWGAYRGRHAAQHACTVLLGSCPRSWLTLLVMRHAACTSVVPALPRWRQRCMAHPTAPDAARCVGRDARSLPLPLLGSQGKNKPIQVAARYMYSVPCRTAGHAGPPAVLTRSYSRGGRNSRSPAKERAMLPMPACVRQGSA